MSIAFVFCLVSLASAAASQPDAGTILREFRETPPAAAPEKLPSAEKKTIPVDETTTPRIKVAGFDFDGVTLFPVAVLQEELSDLVGRELTLKQLEVAPQRVIAYYAKRGRIASAFLPKQEVQKGRITIRVIEGRLGAVSIDPKSASRLDRERALTYLRQGNRPGEPIDKDRLEQSIRLLRELPGVSASTTLAPGMERGTSDLVLHLTDAPLVSGTLESDNYGSKSSGEYRGAVALSLNNPLGIGDQLSFRTQTSWESNFGRLAYSLPVGYGGGRLSFASSVLHYDLGGETKSKGDAFTVGPSITMPLVRTQRVNLSAQTGYEFRLLYDEARSTALRNKQIHSGTIGLSTDLSDQLLKGGFNSLYLGFAGGNLDLSGVQADLQQDKVGPKANGLYGKLNFNLSRTQTILENRATLSLTAFGQYGLKNLDSSEQLSLGGVYAVRAYAASEASGDTGFVISAEARYSLLSSLQASIFYDFGWIRQHADPWNGWNTSGSDPNEYALDGAGASLVWTPVDWLLLKGIVASRIRQNPAADAAGKDADGTRREPRFWFQAQVRF